MFLNVAGKERARFSGDCSRFPVPCFYTVSVDVRGRVLVSILLLAAACPAFGSALPVLVCFGDSITAGYGVQSGKAYPDALQNKLERNGYHYRVVNEGTSGATTKDAVASLPIVLKLHPDIVIVEFGGNDGLRGLPLEQSRRNLDELISTLQSAHVKVLLAGITLPPNYGPDYIRGFDAMFRELAAEHHTALVPMIYKDLIHVPGTIQEDGIHPTAKGAAMVADTIWPTLRPLLRKGRQ